MPAPKKPASKKTGSKKTFKIYGVDGNELTYLVDAADTTGPFAIKNAVQSGDVAGDGVGFVALAPRFIEPVFVEREVVEPRYKIRKGKPAAKPKVATPAGVAKPKPKGNNGKRGGTGSLTPEQLKARAMKAAATRKKNNAAKKRAATQAAKKTAAQPPASPAEPELVEGATPAAPLGSNPFADQV